MPVAAQVLFGGERAEQHQELADEAAQRRAARPSASTMTRKQAAKIGICFHSPPKSDEPARVAAVVEQADPEEQAAGRDAVRRASGRCAPCTPCGFSVRMPSTHEAQVRHRRVRDQLLGVVLHVRHQRAVDDADDRQRSRSAAPPPRPPAGTSAARSAGSRRCRTSAARRPGSPSRRSAPRRARRAARCAAGRSAP